MAVIKEHLYAAVHHLIPRGARQLNAILTKLTGLGILFELALETLIHI